ncbi:GntR family transcriptional regulator [Falsirhodobacter sp. 20TX0035]|uniref:GntR family transcriptional regulator n=1 Tax=Falsirhodobacter sp. 20TX0035 TaxID=3022019 RepID=UPI00232C8398|nr:GntR family transcriptional regulator [Falsirhodobacter sp. 20TX0035]MDB6454140.1 GntR family transcriptional regulator [Falsirhodobacter sp. 20TX0035]
MDENDTFLIRKVHKRSAEVQAAEALRDGIKSGSIPLGARLTEINAAEQMGVSRATIRTALHQLVQEGLVVQVPYTGWTVMTLSAQDAWELYTLRASLEALAARLVAERIRAGDTTTGTLVLSAFESLKSACLRRVKQEIAMADLELHKAIIDLAGHRRLQDQYSRIEHQIMIYIRSSDDLVGKPEEIVVQHAALIDAIRRGDAEGAEKAAATHNESEGAVLVEALKAKQSTH